MAHYKKISTTFQVNVFKHCTNNRNSKISILGKLELINPNIKCGSNVRFYAGVLLFGDGLIEIRDNVDIGQGTIIYASKKEA